MSVTIRLELNLTVNSLTLTIFPRFSRTQTFSEVIVGYTFHKLIMKRKREEEEFKRQMRQRVDEPDVWNENDDPNDGKQYKKYIKNILKKIISSFF